VSEPKARADEVEEVVPGVWHWRLLDDRIGALVAAHAVASSGGTVLIDPLPLADEAMASLGTVSVICLTTSSHQRSSWRLRRELGAPVWAPALVRAVEEEPDARYTEGDALPGGLEAIFTPGAGTAQHSLLHPATSALFTPDLFVREPGGPLRFVPARYMHDPAEARRSAKKLLGLEFAILCTGHGAPVTDDPHGAIRDALAAESG
jgi:glyoxylase-like metal-dependent hydrolase (beta-lactamase superfamily II)